MRRISGDLSLGEGTGATSMIPLLDLALQTTYRSWGPVAMEIHLENEQLDVTVLNLTKLLVNTVPGASGFEARFNWEGSVDIDLEAAGDSYAIQIGAGCLVASGHLELYQDEEHNPDQTAVERGWRKRAIGNGAFDFESWCSGQVFVANMTKNEKSVVAIEGLRDLAFDFRIAEHDFDYWTAEWGWLDYDGKEHEINVTSAWQREGGRIAVRVDRLTDDEIELQISADGLRKADIHSIGAKGYTYEGDQIDEVTENEFAWALLSGGSLDIVFDGEVADIVDFGIRAYIDGEASPGEDYVDFQPTGGAWVHCNPTNFPLARTGDEVSRCHEKVTFITLVEGGLSE